MWFRFTRLGSRFYTQAAANSSFITTPIFYVNAEPHIGHLYTAVLADAAHRWQRVKGAHPTLLTTGTDEHGLKVQKAAETQNVSPLELCDRVSHRFKQLFDVANIGYTDYIRTTMQRHVSLVEWFWSQLSQQGYIYRGTYKGWYSVSDETFLTSSQITDCPTSGIKISKELGHVVEWSSEENYLFSLTKFRERLLEWANTKPYPIIPEVARLQVVQWLAEETTSDLSVSRPRKRLYWGIPVPRDNSQTIYVWLDALVNYLTVSSYPRADHTWPATVHIVGKDILRFHAIYWPAFLLAAGLELPKRIVSHAHWTMGKTKMSKSKGNVVDPFEQLSKFGVDPVRYFLLKEGSLHHDGDYSEERLGQLLNADLADTMGNLLQRVTSKKLNPRGPPLKFSTELFPLGGQSGGTKTRAREEDYALVNGLVELPNIVNHCYEDFEFNRGITAIMDCLHQTNQFLERHKPWQLVSAPSEHEWLETVLSVAVESLRLCSCLLCPVIPDSSETVLKRLGFQGDLCTPVNCQCLLRNGETVRQLEDGTCRLEIGGEPLFWKV